MSIEPAHVCDEAETRKRFPQIDPTGAINQRKPIVSWCNEIVYGMSWRFLDATHVIGALRDGTGIQPCHKCLQKIREPLNRELDRGKDRW